MVIFNNLILGSAPLCVILKISHKNSPEKILVLLDIPRQYFSMVPKLLELIIGQFLFGFKPNFNQRYQKSLKEILNDKKILKLGVGIDGDLKRLVNEGYVTPGNEFFLDLRFLALLSFLLLKKKKRFLAALD